jgi:nitroreductase
MPMPVYINEILRRRWSPREYEDRPIEPEKLHSLFEAARWASSCYNEQPWRFVIATRDDAANFARMLGMLMELNQKWAKGAWVVGFTAGKKTFTHNGAPNRFGVHDTGAASATLAVEASALGLESHFMGGFDAVRARSEFGVPDDFEVGAAFAIGYPAGPPDHSKRIRKPIEEIVFGPAWGSAVSFVKGNEGFATDCREWEDGLNAMILASDFDGGYAKYYAEDAVLQENTDEPRVGKALNRAREAKFLEMIQEVHPPALVSTVVDGMRSASEWVYEFTFKDGRRVKLEESAIRQWKDGLVVRERFYLNRA